jgi:hypothetical protein
VKSRIGSVFSGCPGVGVKYFNVVREIREQDLTGRQHEHVSDERAVSWCVGGTGNCVQAMSIPFKEGGRGISKTGTRKHEDLAIGFQRRRTIGNIVRSWKLRTSGPLSGGGIVDSGVPGSARASVGTSVEHGAVRSQDRGPHFKCGVCLSAACGRGVPELHNRV